MITLEDIRYVRLGTSDMDAAVTFATRILGLEIATQDRHAAYLRSDARDHTLVYLDAPADDHTVGFELGSVDELEKAAAQLESAGFPVHAGTASECEQRRVGAFVSFREPSGTTLDLVARPWHSGRAYSQFRMAGITGFSHVGLYTKAPARDEKFWTSTLSARVSDWIGEAPLLRIDEVHHKIALFPAARHGVQHINHQVESIDDIMRSYYLLREQGVRIRFGPGRHPTSGATFLYFEGPDGMTYEYSTGVRLIADESSYAPRQFPFRPASFCMWGAKPDIPEFQT
ncbi:MAG TPA: VOC family protein [Steroidobacteraceae bacterium]|nr:VOC family protein [Steroidobacteraceae bacterium]